MLETLIKTYYQYFISGSFSKKVIGLIYSNLFKKNPDTNFKLVFEVTKDDLKSDLILTTSLTDGHTIKLPVRKEQISLKKERLESFDNFFVVESKDLIINFRKQTNSLSLDYLYSAIKTFEIEALISVVKNKLISESEKDGLLTSLTEQKSLLKALGYQSWVKPKLIFRTLIDTKNFKVSDNSYSSENSDEYSDALDVEIRIEQMLLKKSLADYNGISRVGVLRSKESEAKVFFWLLEGLISDDVAGLSTFAPKSFDQTNVDLKNYTWINSLVDDFVSLISKDLEIDKLIESGALGDHTPALLAIAGLVEEE